MVKAYPHGRSRDGRDYLCGSCGATLPEGVLVSGHWTPSGNVTGVRATTLDGEVVHECGTKPGKGEGEV